MENINLSTPRNIIIALAIANNGSQDKIHEAIKHPMRSKDAPNYTDEQLKEASEKDVVTIIDDDYPQALKHCNKPPFVLFVKSESGCGCRLNAKTRAEAWAQDKKENEYWWNASIQARKDVLRAFSNEIVISVSDKAEITISKGEDSTTYTQYYGRDPEPHDLSEAYAIASAIAKRLFVFHSRPQGDDLLMVALFGLNSLSEGVKSVYVAPEDYSSDSLSDSNRLIEEGANILTRRGIKNIVDSIAKERQ